MSKRLNKDRQEKLEPLRMQKALDELGKRVFILAVGTKSIRFRFRESVCFYWPYSGWASGKTIRDGRGLKNLLKQIDKEI